MNSRRKMVLALQDFFNELYRMIFGGTDMCERYVPEKPAVSIEQLTADASLFIKLSDHLLETPRPIMPDTVAMGHLMGRPAKPLQGDFKQLMDTSKGNIW